MFYFTAGMVLNLLIVCSLLRPIEFYTRCKREVWDLTEPDINSGHHGTKNPATLLFLSTGDLSIASGQVVAKPPNMMG